MERTALPKQHHAASASENYNSSGTSLNSAGRSQYTQYSPVSKHRSYLSHHPQIRTPKRSNKLFRYDFDYPVYGGDWGYGNCVAVSTFNEYATNFIYVLHAQHQQQYNFSFIAEAKVTMPQTKVAWSPLGDLRVLSSGDGLRFWQLDTANNSLAMVANLVKHSKSQQNTVPAPITSFDWSVANPNVAITSSIDTTCTVWDLNSQVVTTQLIAHDQEVFDVAFLHQSQNQFVSVGCDGSARLFDLRSLENSTIIYESYPSVPLLRVESCPQDANLVTVLGQESASVALIDIRSTRNPLKVLEGHRAPVNSMKWLPQGPKLLATGADDCQILLWDTNRGCVIGNYNEYQQINTVLTSPDGKWLGSVSGKSIQAISAQLA